MTSPCRDGRVLVERCVEMSASDFLEARKSELDKFVANMREVELVDERYSYLEHILDQLTEVVNREHSWQSELLWTGVTTSHGLLALGTTLTSNRLRG